MGIDHDAAARYVLGRQGASGGYSFYRTPEWGIDEPNAPDTGAALSALRRLGIAAPRRDATVAYLRALQDDGGGFPTPIIGRAVLNGLAALDATPLRTAKAWARAVCDQALGAHDGATRAALAAARRGLEILGACALSPTEHDRRAVVALLDRLAAPGGGWTTPLADLESTADAVAIGLEVGVPVLEAARSLLEACEHPRLGFRATPSSSSAPVHTLRGGAWLAAQLGVAPRFLEALIDNVVALQRPSGGFGRNHGALATLQDTSCALEVVELTGALATAR